MRVDLIWLGGAQHPTPHWPLGSVVSCDPLPVAVARAVARLREAGGSDAVLHWSPRLGFPDPQAVLDLLEQPHDVWHAGLALGTGGLPHVIDHVSPTWMLNCDPDPAIEASSWRISLDACLARTRVIEHLGHVDPAFGSLRIAALALGHRWIRSGARVRHVPTLVPDGTVLHPPLPYHPDLADELRFAGNRFGRRWQLWAAARMARRRPRALVLALMGQTARARSRRDGTRTDGTSRAIPKHLPSPSAAPWAVPETAPASGERVTVLIPTIERYPYLRVVLDQLGQQTVKPHQVLVIDQTPHPDRLPSMAPDHPDLPIEWIELEVAGQSTARNAGLARATGDTVLFIDDDDEIEPDLIERHLSSLRATAADVSSGVVHEPDSGALSAEFQQFRVSDTFPTNNSMVRREALDRSGWFDEAYDRGERADHDLGMRLYLSGSSMVLEPSIDLLHHHAPRGGLRVHNARAVTRGSTRKSVRRRTSLSPSQIYLWNRYFRADQVSEAILLFMSSNLASNDGPLHRRLARVAVQAAQLPAVRREVRASIEGARVLAEQYPRIPGENLPLPPHAAPTGPQPAGATAEVAP